MRSTGRLRRIVGVPCDCYGFFMGMSRFPLKVDGEVGSSLTQ